MTLDEFVLFFRDVSNGKGCSPQIREIARHLYVGLALDFDGVTYARKKLFENLKYKDRFEDCGENIPDSFKRHLDVKLQNRKSECLNPKYADFEEMFGILYDTVIKFLDIEDPVNPISSPLCYSSSFQRNLSTMKTDMFFCYYISLDDFENRMLYPGRTGESRPVIEDRRQFYRLKKKKNWDMNKKKRRSAVMLNFQNTTDIAGKKFPKPVFLTPYDEAPHRSYAKHGKSSDSVEDNAPGNEVKKIFISYIDHDEEKAQMLITNLKNKGFKTFSIQDILPGKRIESTIYNSMKGCDYFITLISEASVKSKGQFQKILQLALKKQGTLPKNEIFVIPACLEQCDLPVDIEILELKPVDLDSSYDKGIEKILKALEYETKKTSKFPQNEKSISIDADYIAACMGMPEWATPDKKQDRNNQGIVALKFRPDSRDKFFRPTILDAIDHFPFLPDHERKIRR